MLFAAGATFDDVLGVGSLGADLTALEATDNVSVHEIGENFIPVELLSNGGAG